MLDLTGRELIVFRHLEKYGVISISTAKELLHFDDQSATSFERRFSCLVSKLRKKLYDYNLYKVRGGNYVLVKSGKIN